MFDPDDYIARFDPDGYLASHQASATPANDVEQADDLPTPPVLEAARRSIGEAHDGRVRGKTIGNPRLSRAERAAGELLELPADAQRPRTRGECLDGLRPCPWVRCAHHLYLDVNPETGAIRFTAPHLEVWEMAETCALDVADRGGVTLEAIAQATNVTRERVRQVESRALDKIKHATGFELDLMPERAA
ncbi:MAG: DNA-binding protein [Acidimicrobiia bacterium]|nr:DNA-binding protein [Acidimicrobiia bacterium]